MYGPLIFTCRLAGAPHGCEYVEGYHKFNHPPRPCYELEGLNGTHLLIGPPPPTDVHIT